ncbi:MAG TPA: hypothetical protein GYA06_05635 [Chloroflexi bacterium]|jgi:hypothetical protein|nr:hypothetical protein [Chloroflexota bacterium]HPO57594.1 hypothetical protein [Anaerolineaceae bacterium]
MARIDNTLYCDGCGVELTAVPVTKENRIYCCVDCRDGFECSCAARLAMEEDSAPGTTSRRMVDSIPDLYA